MHVIPAIWAIAVWAILLGIPAVGQDTGATDAETSQEDRGFIVGLLEDALGGEGRRVRVDGFAGALSSVATIEQITFADDDGVWLALDDIQLEWTRSALLRGRIEIQQLSAKTLELTRLPASQDTDDMPAAEAGGFALPDLPVSVEIDLLKLDRITLGPSILGEKAELTMEATAQLSGGSGNVTLNAVRIDGQDGQFVIDASYAAASQTAAIDLDLSEAKDGIVARLLNIPDRPELRLQIAGEGKLDDLVTDISLETGGAERLAGQITLQGDTETGRDFALDVQGDLTPLLPETYRGFFGNNTTVQAIGNQNQSGALTLSDLDLRSGVLALQGKIALDARYWPTQIAVIGQIEPVENGPVVLPFANGSTRIDHAKLQIDYDAAQSSDIDARFDLSNLVTSAATLRETRLQVNGALETSASAQKNLQADVTFSTRGAVFADAAMQDAVSDQISGAFGISYQSNGALRLDQIDIAGSQYQLTGTVVTAGLSDAFETELALFLDAQNLSRFSKLAGLEMAGQAEAAIAGTLDLGGSFDLTLDGKTTDLETGVEQADNALAGVTRMSIDVIRDSSGTRLPRFELRNDAFQSSGSAVLKTNASTADVTLRIADSSTIDARLKGSIALSGQAVQDTQGWRIDTTLIGPFDAETTLKGRATGTAPALDFKLYLPQVQRVASQFRGAATVSGTAKRTADVWDIDTKLTAPYGISGDVAGTVTGPSPKVSYSLSIPNVAAVGALINGPLNVDGTAAQQDAAWQIETALRGLSGLRADVSGRVGTGGNMNLTAKGLAPLALANPFLAPRNVQGLANFDLAMQGPAALTSLSGRLSTTGAQLSVPTQNISLTDIQSQIAFNRGRAQIDVSADVSSGGRLTVRGPLTLTGNLPADLAISLDAVQLTDPSLYDTTVNGALNLRGPLTGGGVISGRIDVGETNIQVPTSAGNGFAIVPQISHRSPSQAVRRTIQRAGLNKTDGTDGPKGNDPTALGLNIQVNALSRVFVRGRGLNAELGGALNLSGRTDQVISSGRFNLIRGRLDILGKRFALDEGSIALQGSLDPILRFVATTRTTLGTASIIIEGPASQPEVSFTSTPAAPEDEVLAQIFFNGSAGNLSAFQALQLAQAVGTLAGKGGEGLISKFRRGFGLDDLDVTTNAQGETGLRLGKYISDNIYTDVTIGNTNTAGVSVNIDLSKSVTARGQIKSNGDSSVGVFFEKDY
ncbi:hypothetical protein ASD8599_02970 [Ascidiaceihabitans donghaensis]|uniref:Translocation and assembly module TamB C-terminal domain-containing protein n=1 Tax=Ascidiaceihabitans donghaensis TaxID=1510460 RepID=A0A2R8BGG8_9RHOB|nr:translocation/assembly module TamB domain-containing protein [Ascidiaceihabitans donghaensis]SPH22224.1 hypothetical protein ASD8599_02970 [Ascidiaceihabitans donghaensis]